MECKFEGTNCKSCDIDCTEKAPATVESEQGAEINTHLHNTTKTNPNQIPKYILSDFIALSNQLRSYRREYGLERIETMMEEEIRLSEKSFFATFDSYVEERGFYDNYDRISASYNGITFYMMRRCE